MKKHIISLTKHLLEILATIIVCFLLLMAMMWITMDTTKAAEVVRSIIFIGLVGLWIYCGIGLIRIKGKL